MTGLPSFRAAGLLCCLCLAGAASVQAQPAIKQYKQAVMIPVDGTITPLLEQFLFRRLEAAREDGADLVILRIDSPGGLLEESFSIAERMRSIDWARTVAYVPDMALSGAAIASLGCDEIVMHPDARLGDAGPIFLDEGFMFQHAPEKIVSDLAVRMRTLAKSKGRPPALAEAMVDKNGEVFEVTNSKTGEKSFMSAAELAALDQPAEWEQGKLVLESQKGRFLEVTGQRAVELKLAEATVADEAALKQRFQVGDMRLLEHTWVDTTIYILNRPWMTVLLLIVGLICLYIEFSAPGTAIGGTIAALCFVLFFWSRMLGGTAGWLEVLLFLTGTALVLVEVFVIPGFGFTGVTGSVLIVASVVMASQRFVIPRTSYDVNQLLSALTIMVGSGIGFLVAAFLLRRHFHLIPAMSGLVLAPPESAEPPAVATQALTKSRFELLGQQGVTTTPLRPSGRARFDDQHIDVVAESSYVATGATVRVVEVQGTRVIVKEVT